MPELTAIEEAHLLLFMEAKNCWERPGMDGQRDSFRWKDARVIVEAWEEELDVRLWTPRLVRNFSLWEEHLRGYYQDVAERQSKDAEDKRKNGRFGGG
jgi:hypothetical protein